MNEFENIKEAKKSNLMELAEVRMAIIRKEADIDSIHGRIREMKEEKSTGNLPLSFTPDDFHKAKLKLKFEKERLVDLKCKHTLLEIRAVNDDNLKSLSNV